MIGSVKILTGYASETRAFLDLIAENELPALETLDVATARAEFRKRAAASSFDSVDVGAVRDHEIPTRNGALKARLYLPPRPSSPAPPAVIYYHGGGFVIGDIETHDPICRRICADAGVVVASIEYRLAPEHMYPAAADDALAAFDYLTGPGAMFGVEISDIIVAGDSAGGTLAAYVAQERSAAVNGRLVAQILLYPALDSGANHPSRARNADMFPITASAIEWYAKQTFASDEDRLGPAGSPGRRASIDGVAPALVLTAELDPLMDEGEAYGARLSQLSSQTEVVRFADTLHGFMGMGRYLSAAGDAAGVIAKFIGRMTAARS